MAAIKNIENYALEELHNSLTKGGKFTFTNFVFQ
jgi:hypothetical protein